MAEETKQEQLKPVLCICGSLPIIESETHWYGGGRYKAQERSVSWKAKCSKCKTHVYTSRAIMSEASAVDEWNALIAKKQKKSVFKANRSAAKDKMLFDLDNGNLTQRALGRIIRAVE